VYDISLLISLHKATRTYRIWQNFRVGKLLQFSWFFTQLRIYSRELFEYIIPFNLLTTWHYSSILKCKKIGFYLLSLNIEQDCWLWIYWSSQWGGNCSVENGLNAKGYYINTIPWTEGKPSPYQKATPILRKHWLHDMLQFGFHTRSANRLMSCSLIDQR